VRRCADLQRLRPKQRRLDAMPTVRAVSLPLHTLVRRAIANSPDTVRAMMLSPQQAEVLGYARTLGEPVRSSEVAKRFKLSIQQACMVLSQLHGKGYMNRTSRPQASGGWEYEYTSTID